MPKTASALITDDLAPLIEASEKTWKKLAGSRIFVTGGTGFFGSWLLNALSEANRRLDLGLSVVVLTRDPGKFARSHPGLSQTREFTFHTGDVSSFTFPDGPFTHVIHGATSTSLASSQAAPLEMFNTIVKGTERALELARAKSTRRFLLTSSGAAYGRQPTDVLHQTEDQLGAPITTDPASAYGEGKRAAELLCAAYAKEFGVETVIARCFAFVGPHLPLNGQFAIGNFLRDAMVGGPIRIGGDGTPLRSYLYASDLAHWLITLLVEGKASRVYNVGSEEVVSISELARIVAQATDPAVKIETAQPAPTGKAPERYVPSTARARTELGLKQTVNLSDAIGKTAAWHRCLEVSK